MCRWRFANWDFSTSRWVSATLAVLLGLVVVVKPVLFIGVYGHPWGQSLPLDLCRLNEALCAWMLFRRSYRVFEVAYFLAMAGSVSALAMPDLVHGYPDPRFLMFFTSHGLAVVAVLYAVFGWGFRPTLRSVGIYTLLIAALNPLLDANYLFLRAKPEGASVLDHLGPWPFYVIGLIGLAVVACLLCYLPFALAARRSSSGSAGDAR